MWDHFPILLDSGGIHGSQRYFKLENMWLGVIGFVDKVRNWWSSYQFTGTPSFILAGKLRVLKFDLKKWKVEVSLMETYMILRLGRSMGFFLRRSFREKNSGD